jgi:hypothetical protein
MMKKILIFCCCIILSISVNAQQSDGDNVIIDFSFIGSRYISKKVLVPATRPKIDMLKFYVGHVAFYLDDKYLWTDSAYYLIDFDKVDSRSISIPIPQDLNYDHFEFNIGVDSITNISGAFDGDLDPINGMYWAWNTGYINAKIEGAIFQKGEEMTFKFHLGGYQDPNQTINSVSFSVPNTRRHGFYIDFESFMKKLNLDTNNAVMSPSANAVLFSKYFSECFILNGN